MLNQPGSKARGWSQKLLSNKLLGKLNREIVLSKNLWAERSGCIKDRFSLLIETPAKSLWVPNTLKGNPQQKWASTIRLSALSPC